MAVIIIKFEQCGFYKGLYVQSPKDADRMINSVDPDETAPSGVVWSGFILLRRPVGPNILDHFNSISLNQ